MTQKMSIKDQLVVKTKRAGVGFVESLFGKLGRNRDKSISIERLERADAIRKKHGATQEYLTMMKLVDKNGYTIYERILQVDKETLAVDLIDSVNEPDITFTTKLAVVLAIIKGKDKEGRDFSSLAAFAWNLAKVEVKEELKGKLDPEASAETLDLILGVLRPELLAIEGKDDQ